MDIKIIFFSSSDVEYFGSEGDDSEEGSEGGDVDSDELGSLPEAFQDMETKSRFTDYSMSSSVIRRNEQLTLLDERFEQVGKFCV